MFAKSTFVINIFIMLMTFIGISQAYGSYSTSIVNLNKTEINQFDKYKDDIHKVAVKTGTSMLLLTAIADIESNIGINTINKSSNARGIMQFTPSTWDYYLNLYGEDVGLTNKAKRTNAKQALLLSGIKIQKNKEYLKKMTHQYISDGDLYMAHFVGVYGAVKLIKGKPNAPISRYIALAKGNERLYYINGKVATVKQFRHRLNSLVTYRMDKFAMLVNHYEMDKLINDIYTHPAKPDTTYQILTAHNQKVKLPTSDTLLAKHYLPLTVNRGFDNKERKLGNLYNVLGIIPREYEEMT